MASTCSGGLAGVACHVLPYIPIVGGYYSIGQKAVPGAISAVGGSVLSQVAQSMASAANGLVKTLATFWMSIDTPSMGAGSPVTAIEQQTDWITTAIAVVCILVAATRMAIRRRGEPAAAMMMGLVRLIVVCFAGAFLVTAAGKLGDMFSTDIMSTAHLGSGGWSGVISTAAISAAFAGGDGMLLIVALLIIISSLIQLMLMVLRVGLLIILTGTLPLAAAASMSEWGESWWRKHLAWLTAWLLYKPAAALLYAGAFILTRNGNSLVEVLAGFMILVLSVLTLPALLKVIVPMTAHLGAASGGSLALAATGAMATGAIKAAAMLGSGGTAAVAGAAAGAAPSGNLRPAGDASAADPSGSGSAASAGGLVGAANGGAPDGASGGAAEGGRAGAGQAQTPSGAGGGADGKESGQPGNREVPNRQPRGGSRSSALRKSASQSTVGAADSPSPSGAGSVQSAPGTPGAPLTGTGTTGNAVESGEMRPLPEGASEIPDGGQHTQMAGGQEAANPAGDPGAELGLADPSGAADTDGNDQSQEKGD
jgi:hypothetical protein